MAAAWQPHRRPSILTLIGAIFAGIPHSPDLSMMRSHYSAELPPLQRLADETLQVPSLARGDFVYVVEAAMAFRDVEPWSTQLNRLVDGEFDATCSQCGSSLYIVIGDSGFFTATDDYALRSDVKTAPIRAAGIEQLDTVARWLYDKAAETRREDVATCIQYLFGYGTCVNCGADLSIPERIAAEYAA